MPNLQSLLGQPVLAKVALAPLVLVVAVACSRDPAPPAKVVPKSPVAAVVPSSATPAIPGLPADRMDCTGADGIRLALDFNAAEPRAFEYASSNPADRSIVCRYLASNGDATSTWQRAADGKLTIDLKEGATSGPARFILAPNPDGWRAQIVAEPKSGPCFSTPPPNLLVLSGRPGQECSLTAQGGIAAVANAAVERQQAFCEPSRMDVALVPSQSQDPAAIFRELPEGIIGMSPARREEVLAMGSDRVEQLDSGAGYLSVKSDTKTYEDIDDTNGYRLGTFRDGSGRTVVAVISFGQTGVQQGIWRADAKGWQKVGCELVDDYRIDYRYLPVAGGKQLEVYDPNGQVTGRLSWNGERFVASG
ncbi:MAG: hypothetical protein ABIP49_02020 [Lysobacterales bacterium]